MRLDQFISQSARLSRKEAKQVISSGRVFVNDQRIKQANTKITESDYIQLDGKRCAAPGEQYLILHKPAQYLCATQDAEHALVLDLLPSEWRAKLRIVGRLDLDTTGLLLLTSDGQWLHRITSPKHHFPKCYRVSLAEPIRDEALAQLERGVMLNGENSLTLPAEAQRISDIEILLTITEGRYHQVKRMCAAVGNRVVKLHRESIASLTLAGLNEGEYRSLTSAEIDLFNH